MFFNGVGETTELADDCAAMAAITKLSSVDLDVVGNSNQVILLFLPLLLLEIRSMVQIVSVGS